MANETTILQVGFLKAKITDQEVTIEPGKSEEVLLHNIIDFTIEVGVGQESIYVNFTEGGKVKRIKIAPGESRDFTPENDFYLYDYPIWLYNDSSSSTKALVIKNVATNERINL